MNLKHRLLTVLTALWGAGTVAVAQDMGQPAITIQTDAYKEIGATNKFRILIGASQTEYFDIDFGWGPNEYEVEQAYIDQEAGELTGTWIPATVSEAGVIKIYGDASKIDVLDIEGAYITDIDLAKCNNLQVLGLEHNKLQSLDLSAQKSLYALYLTDNPFTPATPLNITAPKPYLSILEIDIIDYMDPAFSFSDFPALQVVDAYHNLTLAKADVSGCPNLLSLSLEMTAVETLDISKNPALYHLNISESRITEIDLTKTPKLQRLLAGHVSASINPGVKLKSIDVTKNPLLTILDLSGNGFKEVDLTHNTQLTNLTLTGNSLTGIDLSKNTELYSVGLNRNNMDFATLPLPQSTWGEYFYFENDMPVARTLNANDALDLSARVLREGTVTSAAVWRKILDAEDEPLEEKYWSYADGVVKFNDVPVDSVYVKYYNDVLSEYPLSTTVFMVKSAADFGKPTRTLSLWPHNEGPVSLSVGIAGATPAAPVTFQIKVGLADPVEFTCTGSDASAPNAVVSASAKEEVSIYIPQDAVMTAFAIAGTPLEMIDLTSATELQYLSVTDCALPQVALENNRCLQYLDLSGNALTQLDLTGVYGDYEKNMLSTLKAANNKIAALTLTNSRTFSTLDLSGNLLAEFSLKDYDNIRNLNLSGNLLEGELNLAYLTRAENIDISGNMISSLVYDTFNALKTFNASGNCLTTATLPYLPGVEGYTYAPQREIKIYAKGGSVNLSRLDRTVGDNATTYTWYRADGTPVTAAEATFDGGAVKFTDYTIGKVYCVVANPAFPQFTGENILRTTLMEVAPPPSTVVATFTTLEDAENAMVVFAAKKPTEIFIDWRGDKSDYMPYVVGTSFIQYPEQTTYAGANVTVYTYGDAADYTVFSMNEIKMGEFDGSALTGVSTLALSGCGLEQDKVKFPETNTVTELLLAGNHFTGIDFAKAYPSLYMLNMSGNSLTSFDGSGLTNLQVLYLDYNQIEEVKFLNPNLWNLSLNGNKLEKVTLTGLTNLEQLMLDHNLLTEINLAPVRRNLRTLTLAGNRFTFATLPVPEDYSNLDIYYYGKQANLEAQCIDGIVDLSSQYMVKDVPSTFYWFLDEIVEDPESGDVSGEELIKGEEYTIEDGVTTFLVDFAGQERVMCMVTNMLFPNAYMRTGLMNTEAAGVEGVFDDLLPAKVNVHTIDGKVIKTQVEPEEALRGLEPGLYIVGGRKVLVTRH